MSTDRFIYKGQSKEMIVKDEFSVGYREWVEGYLIAHYDDMYSIAVDMSNTDRICPVYCPVYFNSLCQFTGYYDATEWKELSIKEQEDWLEKYDKKDWYGKKIFENDIIIDIKFPEIKYVVKWSNLGFTITPHCDYNDFFDMLVDKRFKVIGNIIDNPEIIV